MISAFDIAKFALKIAPPDLNEIKSGGINEINSRKYCSIFRRFESLTSFLCYEFGSHKPMNQISCHTFLSYIKHLSNFMLVSKNYWSGDGFSKKISNCFLKVIMLQKFLLMETEKSANVRNTYLLFHFKFDYYIFIMVSMGRIELDHHYFINFIDLPDPFKIGSTFLWPELIWSGWIID
jgi:hypothetical protein